MSFMELECPWCGHRYTAGVVGTRVVGTGHVCRVEKFCEEMGCLNPGEFYVRDMATRVTSFACGAHLAGKVILRTQSRED